MASTRLFLLEGTLTHSKSVEIRGQPFRSQFLPSTTWVLGVKFGFPDLLAKSLSTEASHWTSILFFETKSLAEAEAHQLDWAGGSGSPRDPPVSTSLVLGLQMCVVCCTWLLCGCRDLTLSSHPCQLAHTLSPHFKVVIKHLSHVVQTQPATPGTGLPGGCTQTWTGNNDTREGCGAVCWRAKKGLGQ